MVNVDKRSIVLELQLENKKMVRHDRNSRLTAIFLPSKKKIFELLSQSKSYFSKPL